MVISSRNSAGIGPLDDAVRQHLLGLVRAVAEQVDHGGGRRDPLRHHLGADQGVDEGRFAGVELADDHQEEERRELLDRLAEGILVLIRGRILGQDDVEALEDRRLFGKEIVLLLGQQAAVAGLAFAAAAAEDASDHRLRRPLPDAAVRRPPPLIVSDGHDKRFPEADAGFCAVARVCLS